MKVAAISIVCALAGAAGAEEYEDDPPPPEDPPTHDTALGFRIGFGMQPVDDLDLQTMSLGLAVEHRVARHWRVAGEYEYIWLGIRDTEAENQNLTDGAGHRATVVVRHHLWRSKLLADGKVRLYADVEVGGGFLLAAEPMAGTIALPHALAGLRVGYDFIRMRRDTRASSVWEPEVFARAIATPGNRVGYLAGIGMYWGD